MLFRSSNIGSTIGSLQNVTNTTSDTAAKQQLTQITADFQQHAQDWETERSGLLAQVNTKDASITALTTQVTTLQQQSADKDTQIATLQKQVTAGQAVQSANAQDLTTAFKTVMDNVHAAAQTGQGGATIKSMDIEVKGLVVMQAGSPVLQLPAAGAAVDPNSLSTMRVSFSAVPPTAKKPTKPPGG